MFSIGDNWEQEEIAKVLKDSGFQTFLPQRDGLVVGSLLDLLHDKNIQTDLARIALEIVRRCIFALDMYELIQHCTSAVFNLDGRVPDDGSLVETPVAYAWGNRS